MSDENVIQNRNRQVDKQELDNARVSWWQQVVPSGTIRPWLRPADSPAPGVPPVVPGHHPNALVA